MNSRAYILATMGPSCLNEEILSAMVENGMDAARFNFAWRDDSGETKEQIKLVRAVAKKHGRDVTVIADLPGPRIQLAQGHTYDPGAAFSLTKKDEDHIRFCITENISHLALSFVSSGKDVLRSRDIIRKLGGTQKIIAKIERKIAVDAIDGIIEEADAIMVARGDLGEEIPLPQLPFVQARIIAKAKAAGKTVIVATEMLESMTEHPTPTRAEVTDVAVAILEGADAVMLSEETASGKYPSEAVAMMEQIVLEAEKHLGKLARINHL